MFGSFNRSCVCLFTLPLAYHGTFICVIVVFPVILRVWASSVFFRATFDSPLSGGGGGHWHTPPRAGVLGGSGGKPGHIADNLLGTPGTGSSLGGGSQSFGGGRSTGGSCSKASRNRDRQHHLSNFFIDAAWAMLAVLNPAMALLRNSINFSEICGEEYEIDYGRGGLRLRKDSCELPLGAQTYYMPNDVRPNVPFTQGIVIKVNHERKSYDIQASNGLVDRDIPCIAVTFSVKPLVPFSSTSSLLREVIAVSGESRFHHDAQYAYDWTTTTTAHLLRLLTCLMKWSKKWSDIEIVEHEKTLTMSTYVDLSVLCGQLVWLLVVNLAHHSCCASDCNEIYLGIGDQLDDIRELIKPADVQIEERGDAFLTDPHDSWDAIRTWFERMYQRIMFRSRESEWANVVEEEERHLPEEPSSFSRSVQPR